MTVTNSNPRKNFVLYIANTSRTFEILNANNCISENTKITKITKISIEKIPKVDIIIKNQKVNPEDTASALKRGGDNSILYRINKSH